MQSSSSQETMPSQNRRRAPAWTEWELQIAHSKEVEKLVSPTARICLSPWTWTQYPPNPPMAGSRTLKAEKGPLRLVKIRRRKKRTRDEMFSDPMLSSHTDRAQQNTWRQTISECRKTQYDREERWQAEGGRWRQLAERRQESMLRLLEDQTHMLQCMVELQKRQREHRLTLQPLCSQPPCSPGSTASSPRHPRTRSGGLRPPSHSTPEDCPSNRRLAFNKL
ncbi:uncharacterized protein [Lepidochelys kempii]|uniref:uncharacterized protein n=1 Tax=Lepidochelys kempii TaxID=8472 RepID=UPI003C6F1913